MLRVKHLVPVVWGVVAVMCATAFVVLPTSVEAQERFVTQSGGRGLQNAKTNARVAKTENDVKVIFEDLDDIEDFARVEIASCSSNDSKLRWTGSGWTCSQEIDPTVQEFAKSALPSCAAGTTLSARNNRFECVEDGGLTEEVDPTVMDFAKNNLPSCSAGQVLSANGSSFSCIADDAGITVEVDPTVASFAKSLPPACGVGEVLKSNGSTLYCVEDDAGITTEVDPSVFPLARNDQEGYNAPVCEENYVLTTNEDGTQMACVADQGSPADMLMLGDLGDVDTTNQSNNTVLMYDGALQMWVPKTEIDPNVQDFARNNFYTLAACAEGQVLSTLSDSDASQLKCISDAGGALDPISLDDLADVIITAAADDQVIRFDGTRWINTSDKIGSLNLNKWCRATADEIICDVDLPPVCSVGEVLQYDGSAWRCDDAGSTVASAIRLTELEDVEAASAVNDEVLRFNGTNWVNSSDKIGTMSLNKWCTSNGANINCETDAPVTCTAPDVIRWTGTTWQCEDVATAVANAVSLTDISNVDTTGEALGQVLQFDGTEWVDATLKFIAEGDSQVVVSDSGAGAVQIQVDGVAAVHVDNNGNVGIGDTTPDAKLDVVGDVLVEGNLTVTGEMLSQGDVTIEGVTFSQGGISATGSVSATEFYGSGANLTDLSHEFMASPGVDGQLLRNDGGAISGTETIYYDDVNGRLGIGTSTPQKTLDVDGVVAVGDTTDGLQIGLNGTTGSITGVDTASGAYNNLLLNTVGSEDQLFLETTGDVGVGTTNPNAKLDVAGLVSATGVEVNGDTTLNGNLIVNGTIDTTSDLTVGGVTFSQGGISATGDVSATNFYGDGTGVTNVTAASVDWYDVTSIPTGVQNISNTALTPTELGYLQGTDQALATTSSVTFLNVSATALETTGDATFAGSVATGALTATGNSTVDGDLTVTGNLLTQGDTTIEGVTFSQGGISATGDISATNFYGDGTGLTNVTAASTDRLVSGTTSILANEDADIDISTNGVQRMTVLADGKVGIGTDSPQADLQIGADGTSDTELRMYSNSSGDYLRIVHNGHYAGLYNYGGSATSIFSQGRLQFYAGSGGYDVLVDNDGDVGIGITNPNAKLDVAGTVSATGLEIDGDSTLDGDVTITGNLLTQGDTTIEGVTFSQGGISATGDISATNFYGDGSGLVNLDLDAITAPGSDEQFLFNDGGDISATANVYFDNETGRVGIGASAPTAPFEVSTTGSKTVAKFETEGNATVEISRRGTNSSSGLLAATTSGKFSMKAENTLELEVDSNNETANSALVFRMDGSELARWDVNKNLGLGVTNPNAKLDVAGTVSATGLEIDGDSTLDGDVTITGNLLTQGDTTIEGVTFSQGGISATGDISATNFYGDGSGLTSVVAASADRLVSGTTSVVAAEDGSLTISTNGSQRMVVGDNGRVGIGTDSPDSALHIRSNTWADHLTIERAAAKTYMSISGNEAAWGAGSGISRMSIAGSSGLNVLTSGGNVGIGTNTPNAKLEVAGKISATEVEVNGDTTLNGNLVVNGTIDTTSDLTVGGVTFSQGGISATGDISATNFYGDGSGLVNLDLDAITAPGNDEQFLFNDGGNISATANVYFDNETGRVGIGTSNPSSTLHVVNNMYLSANGGTYFNMHNVGTDDQWKLKLDASTGDFAIQEDWNQNIRFVIENTTGNVGIGITNPNAKLDVAGTVSATEFRQDSGTYNIQVKHGGEIRGSNHLSVAASNSYLLMGAPNGNIQYRAGDAHQFKNGDDSATWMTIDNTGDVGISTTNPSEKLEVVGNVSATAFIGDGSQLTNLNAGHLVAPGNDGQMIFNDGGNISATSTVYYDDTTGRVGIGTDSPVAGLDISNGSIGLMIGAENLGIGRTDNTNKSARVAIPHYSNSEEGMAVFAGGSSSSANILSIGGGTGLLNAASQLDFFTAPNTTTTYGTRRMTIQYDGDVGIGTAAPKATLHVSGTVQVAGTGAEDCTSTTRGQLRYNPATQRMQMCRP